VKNMTAGGGARKKGPNRETLALQTAGAKPAGAAGPSLRLRDVLGRDENAVRVMLN